MIASHTRGVEKALHQMAGRLPPMDIATAARCWTGAVYEAVYSWLERPEAERPPAQAVAATVAGFNLRAIGAAP